MAVIRIRGQLKALAGEGEVPVSGASVAELLRELERTYPPLRGWILDERGHIRRHINVFVNGTQANEDSPAGADDSVEVIPAISGGST